MPTITIRNLDQDTKRNLQALAAMNGRSMEAEARQILREVAGHKPGLIPEPYPPFAPEPEAPGAAYEELAPSADQNAYLAMNEDEMISGVNRTLEKMGLSRWAIPENPPPE